MIHPHDSLEPQIGNSIRQLWRNLTEEEISCYEGLRDVFFLAVRKKHGLPRAQAQEILRNLAHAPLEEAAA